MRGEREGWTMMVNNSKSRACVGISHVHPDITQDRSHCTAEY